MSGLPPAGFVDDAAPGVPPPGDMALPEAGFLEGEWTAREEAALALAVAEPAGARSPPARSLLWLGAGLLTLFLGWLVLGFAGFIADLFARHAALGWLGLAVMGLGLGLIGRAVVQEWRAYASLSAVDALRHLLSDPRAPLERSREAARRWVTRVAREVPEAARALPEIEAAGSRDVLLACLRSAVMPWIDTRVAAASRRHAAIVLVASAASPAPALDTVIVLWRGLVLLRHVAGLHGVRPGGVATARLLANVSVTAAASAAADMAATAMARQFIESALVARLGGEAAGASMAGLRMFRLARVAATACSPLPRGG